MVSCLAADPYEFTDTSGRKLEANILECDSEAVKVERIADKMVFKIPLENLSEKDRDYLHDKFLQDTKVEEVQSVKAKEKPEEEEVYSLVEETKLPTFNDITFFVRFPRGAEYDEQDLSSRRGPSQVRGVMAVLSWEGNAKGAKQNITKRFKEYREFADKHDLALITWTNFKGYKIGVSGDEMEEDRLEAYEEGYRDRAREWRTGYKRLCRRFNLPEENLMMYGLSGGAQMAHRLALQEPEYFFAVHMHVNSSYDTIRRDGEHILWLVTTGTLEYGYPAAVRFYREALERDYHMIFRAEENLGHSGSPDTLATSLAFFEYCMKFLPDPSDPDWREPPVDRFYLMRYPTFIGDYLNTEAFKTEVAEKYVGPEVMVALPNKEIAEAWGTVLDLE